MLTPTRWASAALISMIVALAACSDDGSSNAVTPTPSDDADVQPDVVAEPDVGQDDVTEDVPDEVEVPDRDGDGVSDEDEIAAGTDPDLQDSDGDGFWDGWELADGTDPNDPNDTPTFELPEGVPFALALTDILEPQLLRPLLASRLGSIPPILVYVEGLTDGEDDTVRLRGGIGEPVGNGDDEVPGTDDDVYAMRFSSISQLNGQFLIQFDGQVQGGVLMASTERIELDLSGVSEITEGVLLQVEEVEIDTELRDGLREMAEGNLAGIFTRDGVAELASQFSDIVPVDPDIIVEQLDSDGDGIIPVHFNFEGRQVVVEGFAEPEREVEPPPRAPGPCCPEGVQAGDPIDPLIAADVVDQGIQPDEEALAQQAIEALIQDPEVQFVTTMRLLDGEFHYFVYSSAGTIEFVRQRGPEGTTYPIINQEGDNPLANTDPADWGTLEELLALEGANPEGTTYPDRGYPSADDDRLYFLEAAQMAFPFAFERIAALYDDPRAGDLTLTEVSHTGGGFSSHGHLGALQSRSPFVLTGPGIRSAADTAGEGDFVVRQFPGDNNDAEARDMLFLQRAARGVDIAPTIAAALGITPHDMAVRDGRFAEDALLAWQDGRVLEEVFTDDALAQIALGEPVARYALIIINDGLTAIEINHEAVSTGFDVAAYRRLYEGGMAFQFGSITNWPSNTYPSHNMIGMGAYSGHHGILDNTFFEREVARSYSPLNDLFETERFIGSAHANMPVETLFEAVHRTFGPWDGTAEGTFTASFNDPSSRGATFATLERRTPDALPTPSPGRTIEVGDQVFDVPEADTSDFEGLVDNATLFNLQSVYLSGAVPVPRMAIVNFSATDGGGHAFGPHGDFEREVVIPRTSDRLEILLAILEAAGVLDETLIVLSSDHGMELKDASRQGSTTNQLTAAGVRVLRAGNNLFFKRLAVDVQGAEGLAGGEPAEIAVSVVDRHTLTGPEQLPVVGAVVRVVSGAQEAQVATDGEGRASLMVTPDPEAEVVELVVEHDGFNVERIQLSL